jgi:hypothetical protein
MKTEKKKQIIKTMLIFGLGVAVGYSVAQPDKVKKLWNGLLESKNKGVDFIKHQYK